MTQRLRSFATLALLALPLWTCAQYAKPQRPTILGIAHIGLYTDDLANTAAFFTDYLGFGEPYYLRREGKPTVMFIKLNDRQYVEFVEDTEQRKVKYRHTAFQTGDIEAMRVYLRTQGLAVPDEVSDTGLGFKYFLTTDFNGHEVEFLEYTDKGLLAEHMGENMPDTRISEVMSHVGWCCPDAARDMAFYGYLLGFNEFWRGGANPERTSWIKMYLPESTDYIELMLFDHELSASELGSLNHMNLDVNDVNATKQLLDTRKLPEGCTGAGQQRKGINGFGQTNTYLKDKTRIEVMTKVPLGGAPSASTWGVPQRLAHE